jgi:hypothetical protein
MRKYGKTMGALAVTLGVALGLLFVPSAPAQASTEVCSSVLTFTPYLCMEIEGSGTEGNYSNEPRRCDYAVELYGTLSNGSWWGSAKRLPCGDWNNTYEWGFVPPKRFKADTKLCFKGGIYNPATGTSTWDNAHLACAWIEA